MTTPFTDNFESHIINELMLAQQSIKIAVAWFNSKNILDILCWKLRGGVSVKIILQDDDINFNSRYSLDFTDYKKFGGILILAKGKKSIMHAKFCIIDDRILLHGSCNWTFSAFNKNDETLDITLDEPSVIDSYLSKFSFLNDKYTSSVDLQRETEPTNFDYIGEVLPSRINGIQDNTDIQQDFFFAPEDDYLQSLGDIPNPDPIHIQIKDAKKRMKNALKLYIKGKPVKWLKGYDKVVSWLTDNDCKGLLLVGTPGLGKSIICQRVLPYIIGKQYEIKIVEARELHDRINELKRSRIVVIDNLGWEPRKHYGDIDQSFYELCDNAECTGNILVIATNLATAPLEGRHLPSGYHDSILNRYGDGVLSRLHAITSLAIFEGPNMREFLP